jgi:hypothetical protein
VLSILPVWASRFCAARTCRARCSRRVRRKYHGGRETLSEGDVIMASAKKMKLLGKTIGWRVYLSHAESHDVASKASTVSGILKKAGVTAKAAVLVKLSSAAFNAACKLGKHRGTKLMITLVPPGAVVLPRGK